MTLGNKQFIEEAKDNLAAMGTDAAHMIAAAKKKFEAYRVATSGVIPVTSQYVELFSSNWAEAGNVDGWSTYTYDSSHSTTTTTDEHTAASVSGGFWFVKAGGSYDKREEHSNASLYPPPPQWADWLATYGPLWVTVVGAPSHAIVVKGIAGDLTPDGTTLEILNPWDINTTFDDDEIDFNPSNNGLSYTQSFTDFADSFGNLGLDDYGSWRVLYLPSAP